MLILINYLHSGHCFGWSTVAFWHFVARCCV